MFLTHAVCHLLIKFIWVGFNVKFFTAEVIKYEKCQVLEHLIAKM